VKFSKIGRQSATRRYKERKTEDIFTDDSYVRRGADVGVAVDVKILGHARVRG